MLSEPIKKFVDKVAELPSIGPRQAMRLAFYLVSLGKAQINELAAVVNGLKNLNVCGECFFVYASSNNLCGICADENRKKDTIMIIEKETDLFSIEKTRKYSGRYLVLGDLKKNGSLDTVQKLRLSALKTRIKNSGKPAKEIILAINPTTVGDLNATMIAQGLKDCAHKITRLGRGIPTGGEIEFADEETLSAALERRI